MRAASLMGLLTVVGSVAAGWLDGHPAHAGRGRRGRPDLSRHDRHPGRHRVLRGPVHRPRLFSRTLRGVQ